MAVDPDPAPDAETGLDWRQLVFARLLVALYLLLLLNPLGQAAELERLPGGEPVAVAAVESLPAGLQILPQHPLPPSDAVPSRWRWSCGSDARDGSRGLAPRTVARPEPWLREWRSVALLR